METSILYVRSSLFRCRTNFGVQANVLVDGSGIPRLAGFGFATVVGNAELQWTTAIAELNFDPRWHAPEVVGIDGEPERPTFQSDIYSLGSVMFFVRSVSFRSSILSFLQIASGNIPWQKKHSHQICIELSKRTPHMRPDNILGNHWNLVQKCWSWNPEDRPGCAEVLKCMNQFDDTRVRLSKYLNQPQTLMYLI
jgi:serine/threonine protein kinase